MISLRAVLAIRKYQIPSGPIPATFVSSPAECTCIPCIQFLRIKYTSSMSAPMLSTPMCASSFSVIFTKTTSSSPNFLF